jgi:proton-dependent oligopeptide transporter, POT family
MWERFSYYGMRSLLILYMATYLLADPARAADVLGFQSLHNVLSNIFGPMNVQQVSSQIYGLYTGFVYFTPFFGGMLADQILGQYRTVYLGGFLMAIGHFLMASERLFLLALLFLILGNGCFKPNISTQVGNLYKPGDARRDGAFTIFYMGINLGALLSPFVCGTLGQKYSWHLGFAAAGVGMLLGVIFYWLGSDLVPRDTLSKGKTTKENTKLTSDEWARVAVLGVLCVLNISFFAIYEQQGNTLQLWADQKTDWHFFGMDIPSSWFQAMNPFMIILFAPLLDRFWSWQGKRAPSSVVKMGIGSALCGGAYILMYLAAISVPGDERGSILWLIGTVFIFTMGELYLSPIGLSLVTKVAPSKIVSMMMGAWFLSYFFGNYIAGYLGTFYSVMAKETFFLFLCALGVGTGFIFYLIRERVNRVISAHSH